MPGRCTPPIPNSWFATVGQHRIYQGAAHVAGGRMHHQPRRFIDDDQMLVFIEDIGGECLLPLVPGAWVLEW